MSIDFSEYSELANEGGYDVKPPTSPEDEFFKAVYISGQRRKNHIGEDENPGKLQIRGLRSNLDEINMIITHVKTVLAKTSRTPDNKEKLECFSYQNGNPPWKSTTSNVCGKNAAERASNPFCNSCRSQLIITGIYLDENTNKPFLVNGKPVFIFIRGKGVKYGNVANYLTEMARRDDLEPIVTPVTEESKKFEKAHVNNKRFVTKITVGKQSTNFGMKDVFELNAGAPLSVETVKTILNKSKETIDKFKEKFDWSKTGSGSSDYSHTSKPAEESQKFDFGSNATNQEKPKEEPKTETKTQDFTFDDIQF